MRRLAPLAVALVAGAYFVGFLNYGINLEDEGLILLQIARTARGELPYIDFHTGYTPGAFYLNAWLYRWFGESVIPLRMVLVAVNAATAGCMFALARPFAGGALAAVAALGYAAFLPFFVGDFSSFNVPYPSWYAALAWLGMQLAFDRHLVRRRRGALVVAGLCAGLAFSFKPNAGVLGTLACGLSYALLAAGDGDDDRPAARILLGLAALAFVVLFNFQLGGAEFPLIVGPPLVVIAGRLWRARVATDHPERVVTAVVLVGGGALLPSAPWMTFFLGRLGPGRFLREVLLFGSDADRIYATPYPVPLGFPAAWGLIAALGLVAFGLVGIRAEQGRVRVRRMLSLLVLAGATTAALAAAWSRMPEGVSRSIVWQAHLVAFFTVPFLELGVGLVLLRRLRVRKLTTYETRLLAALVFASCMFVELYPRVDSMHLIVALPSVLVLGAAAARRMADAWSRVVGLRPQWTRAALVVGAAALALVAALPNYGGRWGIERGWVVRQDELSLASVHAPIVVERQRATDIASLNQLLAYLRERLVPDEEAFAFPALSLVPFALDHPTPTAHDYYFPGRPDHADEAQLVLRLETRRPRYVVTMNRRLGFFSESPAYYFQLREWVRQTYRLTARFGRYDVLTRRDAAEPSLASSPERTLAALDVPQVRAWLGDPDRELRRLGARAVLAAAARESTLTAVADRVASDEPTRLLLLRNLGEIGAPEAIPLLVETFRNASGRLRGEAANALNYIALRYTADQYLFAGSVAREPDAQVLTALPRDALRLWVEDYKLRRQVGVFAAWALVRLRDRGAVPMLQTAVKEEHQHHYLRAVAAQALVELGQARYLCTLTSLLGVQRHEVQDTVPSFLITEGPKHPRAFTRCLGDGLGQRRPLGREVNAWVAGAAAQESVRGVLRAALADTVPRVRLAAAWALHRMGEGAALPPLVAGELAAFVAEATAGAR